MLREGQALLERGDRAPRGKTRDAKLALGAQNKGMRRIGQVQERPRFRGRAERAAARHGTPSLRLAHRTRGWGELAKHKGTQGFGGGAPRSPAKVRTNLVADGNIKSGTVVGSCLEGATVGKPRRRNRWAYANQHAAKEKA